MSTSTDPWSTSTEPPSTSALEIVVECEYIEYFPKLCIIDLQPQAGGQVLQKHLKRHQKNASYMCAGDTQ